MSKARDVRDIDTAELIQLVNAGRMPLPRHRNALAELKRREDRVQATQQRSNEMERAPQRASSDRRADMKDASEIEEQRDIAGKIMDNSKRFNVETRLRAESAFNALSWVLGEQDAPFDAGDVE